MAEKDFKDIEPFDIKKDMLEQKGTLIQQRSQYQVAITVPKPRDMRKIEESVLEEARAAGDEFYWTWKVGNKWIEGGTIDLALAIYRAWTNCVLETSCVVEGNQWIFRSAFIDIEKGSTLPRELRMTIPKKSAGGYDLNRWQNMQFQAAQSKNQRDAIFNATSRWLKNKAIETAKRESRKEVERDKSGVLKKAVDFFASHDISDTVICAYFNKEKVEDFTKGDIERLRNLATQLKNGDITSSDIQLQAADEFDNKNKTPINNPLK